MDDDDEKKRRKKPKFVIEQEEAPDGVVEEGMPGSDDEEGLIIEEREDGMYCDIIEGGAQDPVMSDDEDELEPVDFDSMELSRASDYSGWYMKQVELDLDPSSVRTYDPLSQPSREFLDSQIYDFVDCIVELYQGDGSAYFFFAEFTASLKFGSSSEDHIDFCYDQIVSEFIRFPKLEFLAMSVSAVSPEVCTLQVLGACQSAELLPLVGVAVSNCIFSLCVIPGFGLTSTSVTQELDYFDSWLRFLVRYHQHSRYRYIFFLDEKGPSKFSESFLESMRSWSEQYLLVGIGGNRKRCFDVVYI